MPAAGERGLSRTAMPVNEIGFGGEILTVDRALIAWSPPCPRFEGSLARVLQRPVRGKVAVSVVVGESSSSRQVSGIERAWLAMKLCRCEAVQES